MPTSPFSDKTIHLLRLLGNAYDMNETRMDENLPLGDRGDTLADFIHGLVVRLELGNELDAEAEAQAYRLIEGQIDEAATALKLISYTMEKSAAPHVRDEIILVAHAALSNAYACSSKLDAAGQETLAKFVEAEINDLIGEPSPANPKEVTRAMRSAISQVQNCQYELQAAIEVLGYVQPAPRPTN